MKKNDYEMSPEYQKNAAKLVELLEIRDYCDNLLRGSPVTITDEMKRQKYELDKQIENYENVLAAQCKVNHLHQTLEETYNQTQNRLLQRTMEMYINIKHKSPNLIEGFEKLIYENFSPEDAEEYLDQVAILEATKLEEILQSK
jgi:hypothetical protein